jgi:hypothetical protein
MAKKKKPYELELLDEWLVRLGMQDWAIILQTDCDPDEMHVEGSVGCTSWQESTKSAYIQIVDPKKIGNMTRSFDFEEVLVHELLHLKTSLLSSMKEDETLTDRILHTLIDDVARAMVDIKNTERAKYEVLSVRRGKQETDPKDEA